MTLNEFLVKLEATPREWRVSDGALRLGQHCPLSAVADEQPCNISLSSFALGLDSYLAHDIANAADSHVTAHKPLRAQLLKACGLQ
jgi:hypothetical protein